jgi:hypothetical protein
MLEQHTYVIHELLQNASFSYESFYHHLKNNTEEINELKNAIMKDSHSEQHPLIINYINIQPMENKKELLEEVCKIYRKPFLTHRSSLSRVLIVNQEVFLHIIKNDRRFFRDGPERTSVNVIEETLHSYLGTFFPAYFTKEKNVRKKEIYDALMTLEDASEPSLITTTKLRPGTGTGKRRRKRYCLTDDGFHEILSIVVTVLRDELENLQIQI